MHRAVSTCFLSHPAVLVLPTGSKTNSKPEILAKEQSCSEAAGHQIQDAALGSVSQQRTEIRRSNFVSTASGDAWRKAKMQLMNPVNPVNQAKSQQKATATSVTVRNLMESDFTLNFFKRYHYNHVKYSIKYSGQSIWVSVKRND